MRVGVVLDNVLADSQTRLELYAKRLEINTDSLWHPRLISDEAFWAGMTAWPDLAFFSQAIAEGQHELFVLCERPASLLSVTRAWLRRKKVELDHDHLVINSLHRFDCRLLDIDIFITSDSEELKKFSYDRVQAIQICRNNQAHDHEENNWSEASGSSYPIIHQLKESLNYHARMFQPWSGIKMLAT